LLIASLVLAALGGWLYWSNHHKKSDDTDPANKILSLKQEEIAGLDLKRKSGEEETLARDKNKSGTWHITAPKQLNANAQTVSEMVSSLSSLQADHIVDEKATDLGQYGLAPAELTLTISESNGTKHKLLIGDAIPAGVNYYAALEGDPRIFAITNYTRAGIDKSIKDLVDVRLFPAEDTRIDTIELITQNKDIAFAQKNGAWQIQKPQPLRADENQVNHLYHDIEGAQIDLTRTADAGEKAAAAFASGTNYATLRITDDTGAKLLEVHKTKDGAYYAKSSVVDGIYRISENLAQDLDKTVEDFTSKKLFEFGYVIPDQIDIRDGEKKYSLLRTQDDWSSNGKKMDRTSVEYLTSKLRGLTASKFVPSGYTTPSIEITVATNGRQNVEKIVIAKNGNDYIAKRENDPTLYQLDASSVETIEKAAADVKPEDSPKKSDGSGSL
jgi:hypothetical protein